MANLASRILTRAAANKVIMDVGASWAATDPDTQDKYFEWTDEYGSKLYYVYKMLPDGNVHLSVSATCNCLRK